MNNHPAHQKGSEILPMPLSNALSEISENPCLALSGIYSAIQLKRSLKTSSLYSVRFRDTFKIGVEFEILTRWRYTTQPLE